MNPTLLLLNGCLSSTDIANDAVPLVLIDIVHWNLWVRNVAVPPAMRGANAECVRQTLDA